MKIVEKKLDEIKPYENNPRFNDDAVQYVANSIKEFGFKVPIVIDKDNTIVAGHTRYKASLLLGLDKVPCIVADDLNEEQVKAFRLADNKVGEMANWDYMLLDEELADLEISVSVLSSIERINFKDERDLLSKIYPHGIILAERDRRAVYLPVVWEQLPERDVFLNSLKEKAGLPPNYFSRTLEAYRFDALYITE